MGIPETTWVILVAMASGLHLQSHGEQREDKWNFFGILAVLAFNIGLFYWGGFWDSSESQARVARLVWVALASLSVGLHLWNHGKLRGHKWNFFGFLIGAAIEGGLLYCGGFFS